jgi:ribosomal protein S18 acetylase RimI-like enzyme
MSDADLEPASLIRPYAPSDFDAIGEICLRTAEAGRDATGLYVSDELMPDIFAKPYLLLEPELAFVLDAGQQIGGYILGVADTTLFVERYRARWLPGFSRKYLHVDPPGTRDELIRHLGFVPERMLIPELERYPAHLHIDLLPAYQRRGFGRALMEVLVAALRERGVPGLHLSMDPANRGARAFYDRLGFRELRSSKPEAPLLGIEL